MIGPQVFQALLEACKRSLSRSGIGFGCKDEFVPSSSQGITDFLFRYSVPILCGGLDIVPAIVEVCVEKIRSLISGNFDQMKSTKTYNRQLQPCAAELPSLHTPFPPPKASL